MRILRENPVQNPGVPSVLTTREWECRRCGSWTEITRADWIAQHDEPGSILEDLHVPCPVCGEPFYARDSGLSKPPGHVDTLPPAGGQP